MKLLLAALLLALCSGNALGQLREFTDKSGRTMSAKPVNVVGNQVRIEREDGSEFNVPVNIFSEEDQKYLRQWMLIFLAEQERLLEISAKSSNTKVTRSESTSTEIKKWESFYEIKIENESDLTFENLRVEYRFFKFDDKVAADKRSEGDMDRIAGEEKIRLLGPRKTIEIATSKTPMVATELKSNWSYIGGGDENSKDRLKGIWIRVYEGDLMLNEFSNPTTLATSNKW